MIHLSLASEIFLERVKGPPLGRPATWASTHQNPQSSTSTFLFIIRETVWSIDSQVYGLQIVLVVS